MDDSDITIKKKKKQLIHRDRFVGKIQVIYA